MNLWHSIAVALQNLRANKLRSALTMLGVIIGVSAVIMMVAILQGAESRVANEFTKLGSNLILVFYSPDKTDQKATTRRIDGLTMDDVRAIEHECDLVRTVSPEQQVGQAITARYAGIETDSSPVGVLPAYRWLRNVTVTRGRFISDEDTDAWAKVCVIGSKIAANLFPGTDPIGRTIEVSGQSLVVIGQLAPKGRTFAGDQDIAIYLPLSTVQKRILGREQVGVIYAEPVDLDHMTAAKDQVWRLLMKRYQNLPGFKVDSLDTMLNSIQVVLGIFTLVLGSIAGLALLVGGIGIMNIMLVSVTERTREIGIRKAIGAKNRDILVQFLVESGTVSGVGGLTGVAIGTASAYFVGWVTSLIPTLSNPDTGQKGIAMYVPPAFCVVAFAFSACIGLFFGIYPAYRAAALTPVDALRHE